MRAKSRRGSLMAKDSKARVKRVFIRPPTNVREMTDGELERWAEEAVLTPLLGPAKAEPKKSD